MSLKTISENFNSLPELVRVRAAEIGTNLAFKDDNTEITYEELNQFSDSFAIGLISEGLEFGDRVAIWAPNSINWIVCAIGIQKAGGILVPINTRMKGNEASFILNKSEAKFLFTEDSFLGINYIELLEKEKLNNLNKSFILNPVSESVQYKFSDLLNINSSTNLPIIKGEDYADIIFTSGTTGQPKGVIITQKQNTQVFKFWSKYVGLNQNDKYLIVNPFFHTFGYKAGWMSVIIIGCQGYPEPVFDSEKVLGKIEKFNISMLPGPPTLYQSILTSKNLTQDKIQSLRLGVTGAASIPVSLIKDMKEKLGFETVITAYGLTESTGVATMCTPEDDYETVASTSGKAIADVEVKCIDAKGNDVNVGEQGEILIKGYNVMQSYYKDPEATAETITADGWLKTGDVGILDQNGYLKITDRIKDMFIVGGFNAYPAEIENIFLNHSSIQQVAIIGVADERMGEVPKAFIVKNKNDDITAEEIILWAKDNMANYKVPREVVFLDELPTNASGKIMKYKLRT